MEGTIDTPLGHVSKKTAVIGGIGIVVVAAVFFRYEKQKQAAATASAGANTGIDPATGYAYGSAEDAAALANQAAYINPAGGSGVGLVSNAPGTGLPQGFGSNAAWAQYVLNYFQTNGLTQDNGAALSAALGVYLGGGIPTADQINLIHQAIAVAGSPPINGPNGYPPYINTGNPNGSPPPPTQPPPTQPPPTQPPPKQPPPTQPPPPSGPSFSGWGHTTVIDGKSLQELCNFFGMTTADFEAHNPGITSYYRSYIAGRGYVPAGTPGSYTVLNVGPVPKVVWVKGGWGVQA